MGSVISITDGARRIFYTGRGWTLFAAHIQASVWLVVQLQPPRHAYFVDFANAQAMNVEYLGDKFGLSRTGPDWIDRRLSFLAAIEEIAGAVRGPDLPKGGRNHE